MNEIMNVPLSIQEFLTTAFILRTSELDSVEELCFYTSGLATDEDCRDIESRLQSDPELLAWARAERQRLQSPEAIQREEQLEAKLRKLWTHDPEVVHFQQTKEVTLHDDRRSFEKLVPFLNRGRGQTVSPRLARAAKTLAAPDDTKFSLQRQIVNGKLQVVVRVQVELEDPDVSGIEVRFQLGDDPTSIRSVPVRHLQADWFEALLTLSEDERSALGKKSRIVYLGVAE